MKYLLSILIYIILLSYSSFNLFAHGGGLKSEGCHNDRKLGTYHCHRNPSSNIQGFPKQKKFKTSEASVNLKWCKSRGGVTQFRTKDGTFVDCLTELYAVEVEFDNKWKEAIGQSLHYAESTNRKAAILFIKQYNSTKDYYRELNRVINKYQLPITVFIINQ